MSISSKESRSLAQQTWKKLLKSKLSVFGLIVIALSVIITVFGSLIRPDSTPNANEMSLSLTIKPPGFKVKMLNVHKNNEFEHPGFFGRMFFGGRENEYVEVPMNSYRFEGDYIVVDEYSAKPKVKEPKKYLLPDVVYPLSLNNTVSKDASGNFVFYTFAGEKMVKNAAELKREIEANNIYEKKFYLGTDMFGRDMLSRLMSGTLISLSVGFISVFISIVIGTLLGAIAGFFRGKTDDLIMWLINVVWSIPTLLLVIAITLALGKGFWQIFIAVGLTMWVDVARVVRGQVLSLREKEFVEAGRALGFSNMRIILRHVLPNVMGPVIVISAANFASAILTEAGLSFLGIGAQPPMSSWGSMIKDHYGFIIIPHSSYLALLPGLAIMLMVLAFILVGNGLRDALDAKWVDKV